jgi:shikimate kinase
MIERIVLVGLMGSGKTTVGRKVADQLGWRAVDLDQEIEAQAGMSVAQIFERQGESAFRRLEQQLTATLLSQHNLVFTPGGGWITHARAEQIPEHTAVFWLCVSPERAVERIANTESRPLLAGDPLQRARQLAEQRNALYAALGEPIDTDDRTADEVANRILEWLNAPTNS